MGGIKWDPIKDVTKAVTKVNKDVTKAIAKSDLGKVNARITETVKRSDIGKATGAMMMPATALKDAALDVTKGQIGRGLNRVVGGVMSANPLSMAVNASSSLRDAVRSDFGNTITLGLGRDAAEVADRGKSIAATGRAITSSDISSFGRFGMRTLAIGGAAALSYKALGGTAVAGGASAASAGGAAAAGGGSSVLGAVGSAVGATVLPAVTGVVKDEIKNRLRGPASSSNSPAPVQTSEKSFLLPALIGVFLLLLIPVLAGKRKK